MKKALALGVEVKICTGDYLFVTQPEALKRLIELDERIEVRLWRSNGRSFHPKAYLFQYQESEGSLIIGSSNLSRSALTSGVEWNLAMESAASRETFQRALDEFMKLFLDEQTVPVNVETIADYEGLFEKYHREHPDLVRTWTENEEVELMLVQSTEKKEPTIIHDDSGSYGSISPRPSQNGSTGCIDDSCRGRL